MLESALPDTSAVRTTGTEAAPIAVSLPLPDTSAVRTTGTETTGTVDAVRINSPQPHLPGRAADTSAVLYTSVLRARPAPAPRAAFGSSLLSSRCRWLLLLSISILHTAQPAPRCASRRQRWAPTSNQATSLPPLTVYVASLLHDMPIGSSRTSVPSDDPFGSFACAQRRLPR